MKYLAIFIGLLIPLSIFSQDISKGFAFFVDTIHQEDGLRSFDLTYATGVVHIIRFQRDNGTDALSITLGTRTQEFDIINEYGDSEIYQMEISNTDKETYLTYLAKSNEFVYFEDEWTYYFRGLTNFFEEYKAYVEAKRDPHPLNPSNLIREGNKYNNIPEYTDEYLIEKLGQFGLDGEKILNLIKAAFLSGEMEF